MIFKDNLPIYLQIVGLVKRRIASGELKPGEKLPSVRELSSELKVNPNTIQRSYQELERESLVFSQRGTGTFITEEREVIRGMKENMAIEVVENFIESMESLGFEPEEIVSMIESKMEVEED